MRTEKILQGKGIFHGWPLNGEGLDYSKGYDFMDKFVSTDRENAGEKTGDTEKVRNSWTLTLPWRGQYGEVAVMEREDGKVYKIFTPWNPAKVRLNMQFQTSHTRYGSSIREAEERAMKTLRTMVSFFQWHCYFVDGTFVDDGKSGVTYYFRKGRPTLAFRGKNFLCALCLHPLAYYEGTWTGAMVPTDEVIAHYLMVKADEKLFWRKANQIPLEDVRSGI